MVVVIVRDTVPEHGIQADCFLVKGFELTDKWAKDHSRPPVTAAALDYAHIGVANIEADPG